MVSIRGWVGDAVAVDDRVEVKVKVRIKIGD